MRWRAFVPPLALLLASIATADPVPPTPAAERSVSAAVAVVRNYYAAIEGRDYGRAYALWHRPGTSLAAFRRGYARTAHVRMTPLPPFAAEGGAGSIYAEIRVRVDAVRRDGRRERFGGSYMLRRVNDVDGSTAAQRRWRIIGARLVPLGAGPG